MMMLSHPVMKRNITLTDKLLKMICLIATDLPASYTIIQKQRLQELKDNSKKTQRDQTDKITKDSGDKSVVKDETKASKLIPSERVIEGNTLINIFIL